MIDTSLGLVLSSFLGGVFMFLAPCTLPLVPAFLASLISGEERANHHYWKHILLKTTLFSTGFTLVFVLFGILTGIFGSALTSYKLILSQIGGLLVILFGFSLIGVFSIPVLRKTVSKIGLVKLDATRVSTPLILGILFALGWTPCAGPILASILLLAGSTGTAAGGGLLLFIFSIGLAVPFILMGILYMHTLHIFALYERYHMWIRLISGMLLILLGVVLVFGHSILMTHWGFALYSFFGYTPICSYF